MTPQELLALALIGVPGLGLGFAALPPGSIGIAPRLALSFAFGFGAVSLPAVLLASFGALRGGPFVALVTIIGLAAWFVAVRRFGIRSHAEAIVQEVRDHPWAIVTGLVVIAGIVVVRLAVDPVASIPGVASFRYWADATELADTGAFPAQTLQFGAFYPPATSKSLLDAFTAGMIIVVGRDPIPTLGAMLFVSSVGTAAALWGVAWELGLRFTAALLPLLAVTNRVFLNTELTTDLDVYRAESFGRLIAVGALLACVRALRDGRRVDLVVAGIVTGIGIGTHLIAMLVAATAVGWYLVGRLLLRDSIKSLAIRGAAVLGVALLLASAVILFPQGDLAFEGAGGEGYDELDRDFDPTFFLHTGRQRELTPAYFEKKADLAPQLFLTSALGITIDRDEGNGSVTFVALMLVGGLVLTVLMFLFLPRHLKVIGVVGWGLVATMIAVTLFFAYRNDVYILADWGRRRIFRYNAIPLLLMGLALVEAGVLLVAGKATRIAGALAMVLVLVVGALVWPGARDMKEGRGAEEAGPAVEVLNWIRSETQCDSVILTNQRTVGVFKAMTGRVALLEGMTPYLRPEMLDYSLDLMLDARAFFKDPSGRGRLLQEKGIDYVVVLDEMRLGHSYGVGRPSADFAGAPLLELEFQNEGARIYRVTASSDPPDTEFQNLAGYRCESDPIIL
ncbi:hypothetical protein BH20ACT23_BH20ACT23_26000 [soil metagenome]